MSCQICMVQPQCFVSWPCGHRISCFLCFDSQLGDKCALCRKSIRHKLVSASFSGATHQKHMPGEGDAVHEEVGLDYYLKLMELSKARFLLTCVSPERNAPYTRIYPAKDTQRSTCTPVLVKVYTNLSREKSALQCWREAVALKALHSRDHVICLHQVFVSTDSQLCFLVVEHMESELAQFLGCNDPTDPHHAWVLSSILSGLDHIHSCGIMHRDLTPSNILLNRKPPRVVIADFGVCGMEGAVDSPALCVGSLPYMAPESLREKKLYTQKVDIWAFGVVCVALHAGCPLFPDKISGKGEKKLQFERLKALHRNGLRKHLESFPQISLLHLEFILKALSFDPLERPTTTQLIPLLPSKPPLKACGPCRPAFENYSSTVCRPTGHFIEQLHLLSAAGPVDHFVQRGSPTALGLFPHSPFDPSKAFSDRVPMPMEEED
eukprot:NODE_1711_length_1405_cov_24.628326_g1625_i0.p1 GENE.NODE_1711_length_1405_cov_24.628326_g1625_i0~~NODE_1711_length_1405_cov_24.628326_g1625_i0.p1  ORF type:complete len:445 (+),score=88.66 NODE_1711_length_1405_cov_24.628326_g1625_i0:28-1335(+)